MLLSELHGALQKSASMTQTRLQCFWRPHFESYALYSSLSPKCLSFPPTGSGGFSEKCTEWHKHDVPWWIGGQRTTWLSVINRGIKHNSNLYSNTWSGQAVRQEPGPLVPFWLILYMFHFDAFVNELRERISGTFTWWQNRTERKGNDQERKKVRKKERTLRQKEKNGYK